MNAVWRLWWRVLDDARFGVRWVCGRFRGLAVAGVFCRWLLHVVVGNPAHFLFAVALLFVVSPEAAFLLWLVAAGGFELWFQLSWSRGCGSWVHGWRLWWRVRRSIPSEWKESAEKSKEIKSILGGENRISSMLRPIADHPKTAWLPRIEWPVVSAWVGHPPGRTAKEYPEFQRVLAANILRVDNVEFDFDRDRDSIGRLQLTFVDVLGDVVMPMQSRVNRLRVVGRNESEAS